MQVAAHEARQGHGRLAEELLSILDKGKSKLASSKSGKLVPLSNAAKSRTDLGSLLSVSEPDDRIADMVLNETVAAQLNRLVREQRMMTRIREHGLSPRRKVLLAGPPGTGKTLTASALARELGIPLFQVRFDALITKFMGETAARLRQVFDAMVDIRGVYFFDEFDAIGSQRGLTNDVGEIRRVLNSFLQMIEQDESNSVIVAATNYPEILDYSGALMTSSNNSYPPRIRPWNCYVFVWVALWRNHSKQRRLTRCWPGSAVRKFAGPRKNR
ncbi:AAA family ATPase [Enterobacter hormaechei]